MKLYDKIKKDDGDHKRSIFWPAHGASPETALVGATDAEIMEMPNYVASPRWYAKSIYDHYFYYPKVLVSAAHHYKMKNYPEKAGFDDDTVCFVDSGGFQLATGVKAAKGYTREHALDWSEKNGSLYPILDMPVLGKTTWEEAVSFSQDSAKYYLDNRTKPDDIIMNVMSARNPHEMEMWYDRMKDYKFEGWAYGSHGKYLVAMLQSILFFRDKGEFDRDYSPILHMFGVSSCHAILYLVMAQKICNDLGINVTLSYDSSYAFTTIGHGKYFVFKKFDGMSSLYLSNKFDWSNVPDGAKLPCHCKVCEGITDVKQFFKQGSHFYLLAGLHNLGFILDYKETIERLVELDVPELIDDGFPAAAKNNYHLMKKAFALPAKAGMELLQREFVTHTNEASGDVNTLNAFFK
jgi:hypothetical protein